MKVVQNCHRVIFKVFDTNRDTEENKPNTQQAKEKKYSKDGILVDYLPPVATSSLESISSVCFKTLAELQPGQVQTAAERSLSVPLSPYKSTVPRALSPEPPALPQGAA